MLFSLRVGLASLALLQLSSWAHAVSPTAEEAAAAAKWVDERLGPQARQGPFSVRYGGASWENLVCGCVRCNVRKGGRTPQEAGMKLIQKPVRPKRSPMLTIKLGNPKYASWKNFLDSAYWTVDLK